jgi:hypothetical protein
MMPNENDELRRKILDDDASGSPPDDHWRAALMDRFETQRKKTLVYATVWIVIGFAITFGGAHLLSISSQIKLMLLASVTMLIGYETTVLVKLWYWVADTNIRTLREIKRLQLLLLDATGLGGPGPEDQTAATEAVAGRTVWHRISRRRLEWITAAVLVVVGAALGLYLARGVINQGEGHRHFREVHTSILRDGTCEVTMREQYHYAGMNPLESLHVRTKAPLEDADWREATQGTLPHSVEQEGEDHIYTVNLDQPIFRGETVDLRSSARTDEFLAREGDQWTFQTGWTWGRPRKPSLTIREAWPSPVKQTVAVPAGAVVESVTPAPHMSWVDYDGRYLFYFEESEEQAWQRTRNPFAKPGELQETEIRIVYRLTDSKKAGWEKQEP